MKLISAEHIKHIFHRKNEEGEIIDSVQALDDLNLQVKEGQFVCILGRNGSGKSTFAKLLNALLAPTDGTLWVDGLDTSKEENCYLVRQTAGMVFQNPDNQLISPIVEEDVGFGAENLGVEKEQIWQRVEKALRSVGMWHRRHSSTNHLSGGQKQRVAIAGILAMNPRCIVLDEPTAMLDPIGRKEIIQVLHQLNKQENVTIILVTHYMEECIDADYIYVLDHGKVGLEGTPKEIFTHEKEIEEMGLELPVITKLAYELRKKGYALERGILSAEELPEYESVKKKCDTSGDMRNMPENEGVITEGENMTKDADADDMNVKKALDTTSVKIDDRENNTTARKMLTLENVSYRYSHNSDNDSYAIQNISMDVYEGEFLGIIGHTGSGKSTIMQHLNGLIKPQEGNVYFCGENIMDKDFSIRKLRFEVGMVFQYPEYQLFESSVLQDVMFGPRNKQQNLLEEDLQGKRAKKEHVTETYISELAVQALKDVKLPEKCWNKSPFTLSGGQKRKAAIAGILAMQPQVLVLDEPTAGLDPEGRKQILDLLKWLQTEKGITIVMVSHSMDDVAQYATRIIALENGQICLEGKPGEVFCQREQLRQMGLEIPQINAISVVMKEKGWPVGDDCIRIEEVKACV